MLTLLELCNTAVETVALTIPFALKSVCVGWWVYVNDGVLQMLTKRTPLAQTESGQNCVWAFESECKLCLEWLSPRDGSMHARTSTCKHNWHIIIYITFNRLLADIAYCDRRTERHENRLKWLECCNGLETDRMYLASLARGHGRSIWWTHGKTRCQQLGQKWEKKHTRQSTLWPRLKWVARSTHGNWIKTA